MSLLVVLLLSRAVVLLLLRCPVLVALSAFVFLSVLFFRLSCLFLGALQTEKRKHRVFTLVGGFPPVFVFVFHPPRSSQRVLCPIFVLVGTSAFPVGSLLLSTGCLFVYPALSPSSGFPNLSPQFGCLARLANVDHRFPGGSPICGLIQPRVP